MANNPNGFTLLELMVTLAVVGILAAIAIPAFGQYRVRAYDGTAISDLRNAMVAVEAAIDSGDPLPASPTQLQKYGYRPSKSVGFSKYLLQTVNGIPSVHMHTKHSGSSHAWHTRYPADGGQIEIR
ncbi:MAG: prepilin-type N-terminal cleavage/methylation domain-containing protein [Deltaproteobacteria bacterium]|nr:prepilin-type N-terminal cleavage/methylation domain-containing protein [Deltaproteobacteria bacterium]